MKAWSLISVTFVSLTFIAACGSKSDDKADAAAATSAYTYDDVKGIINGSCATTTECHASGSVYKDYSSLAKINSYSGQAEKMVTRITTTDTSIKMPKDDTTSFETTADGEKLLDWLRGGADLN